MFPQFTKKTKKSDPSNYRPISLTCVLCKFLEHIVASSLAKHFTELDIFYEMQHGFREKRSCETILILLIDELAKTRRPANRLILFFDKVVHEKLLLKLQHYGIRGDTLKWIKGFMDNRKQAVVINGIDSEKIPASSGVTQGSVLSQILLLAYNQVPHLSQDTKPCTMGKDVGYAI